MASKGKWKNVQIKISHECHTERNGRSNIVLLFSFPFDLVCKYEWVFLIASALVLCLQAGWLAAVCISSTLIFIKRDKKKNYMQSGTIESMRELNHPRNTKYLWQRVQWIAKVAQMNVLKRIFSLSPLLHFFPFVRFSLVFVHLTRMWYGLSRPYSFPFFLIFRSFNYVLLSTASFSVIFIAAFYSLPRTFRELQEKIA